MGKRHEPVAAERQRPHYEGDRNGDNRVEVRPGFKSVRDSHDARQPDNQDETESKAGSEADPLPSPDGQSGIRASPKRCHPAPKLVQRPPNGWLISCKRPVKTYGPYRRAGGSATNGAQAPFAFVGCISGLGVRPGLIRGGPAGTAASRAATRSGGRRRRDCAAVRGVASGFPPPMRGCGQQGPSLAVDEELRG